MSLPPEVIAASGRMALRAVQKDNFDDHTPQLFRAIMENHAAVDVIITRGSAMSQADWRALKELNRDMKKNLRPAAEAFLRRPGGNKSRAR